MGVGGAVMIRCIFCLQVYGPIARRGGWELISKGGGRRGPISCSLHYTFKVVQAQHKI